MKQWKVVPCEDFDITGHKYEVVTEDGKICIAQVYEEAHAKQIAALPLLIEALSDCVWEIDHFLNVCTADEVEGYRSLFDGASLGHNALAESGLRLGVKTIGGRLE